MPEDTSTPTPGPDETPHGTPDETQPIQASEPPAGGPVEEAPVEEAPKKRRGLLIGVVAVVVLLLIAGGAVGTVLYLKDRPHKISTPATAGGMKRDTATEKKFGQQLKLTQTQIKKQVGATSYSKIAVYNQDKKSRGAVGPVLFFGARLTDKHADSETPSQWVDKKLIKTFTKNKLKVLKVDIGDDGRAVCAEQPSVKTAACVWRTDDSVGELFPINPGWTAKQMSKLMIAVRSDVETQ